MKDNIVIPNILRFIVLVLIQVLILKSIDLGSYVHIYIYPLFLLLLPLKTRLWLALLLGFCLGLTIDMFYDTIGLHAAAAVLTAYLRPFIFNILEPRGGYDRQQIPSKYYLGIEWFLQYSAILMFIHLLFYFSVEAFSIVYIVDILITTLYSYLLSMLLLVLSQYLFNPKV